jgi:hypothetical protein
MLFLEQNDGDRRVTYKINIIPDTISEATRNQKAWQSLSPRSPHAMMTSRFAFCHGLEAFSFQFPKDHQAGVYTCVDYPLSPRRAPLI